MYINQSIICYTPTSYWQQPDLYWPPGWPKSSVLLDSSMSSCDLSNVPDLFGQEGTDSSTIILFLFPCLSLYLFTAASVCLFIWASPRTGTAAARNRKRESIWRQPRQVKLFTLQPLILSQSPTDRMPHLKLYWTLNTQFFLGLLKKIPSTKKLRYKEILSNIYQLMYKKVL